MFVFVCFQLVGNFQTEASQRKQESDQAVTKLSSVRKLIAKLLKSINEVRINRLIYCCLMSMR